MAGSYVANDTQNTPAVPQKPENSNKFQCFIKSAIITAKNQRQMMTYTLTLKSDDESLIRSFKALAREFGAKLEIKEQKRIKALDEAIDELKSGQVERFESFDDFAKAMREL